MIPLPIYKGMKINRMLCFLFLILFAISLVLIIPFRDLGIILAQINGAFALLYAILWAIWAKREKKAELALRKIAQFMNDHSETDRFSYQEYLLPKEQLTDAAFRRFTNILKGLVIAALCVFGLIAGLLLWKGLFKGFSHTLMILLFSVVIMIPGIIMQWVIYKKYEKCIPRKIGLYPGQLVIDGDVMVSRQIRDIQISPSQVFNPHSPVIFREMTVHTLDGKKAYRIDFRGDRSVRWEEYPQFSEDLIRWGSTNDVPVIIAYME